MEIIFQNKYEVYDLKNLIDSNEDIKFYIVVCEIDNKIYHFYKKSTSNKLLAPKKKFFGFEENYLELAVRTLHTAFGLDRESGESSARA
ncbi:hypothetical protein SDC9_193021 [bioreactor metagenome]|uniref:Uncharacterized protein n=1 Tax=bioreactor metagenome TaxID=1076179 RepID=A0A645IAV0_9ZZZZ